MKLPLSKELLRLSYKMLCEAAPFNGWNLPDSEDVLFVVTRNRNTSGYYTEPCEANKFRHEIGISVRCVGTLATLIMIMAHEMIHLYQRVTKPRSDKHGVEHNRAFRRFSDQVCELHAFDRVLFADADL